MAPEEANRSQGTFSDSVCHELWRISDESLGAMCGYAECTHTLSFQTSKGLNLCILEVKVSLAAELLALFDKVH